jgi:hypothetical protein
MEGGHVQQQRGPRSETRTENRKGSCAQFGLDRFRTEGNCCSSSHIRIRLMVQRGWEGQGLDWEATPLACVYLWLRAGVEPRLRPKWSEVSTVMGATAFAAW